MGFFFVENKRPDKNLKGLSTDFLRRHECNVCPLNSVQNTTPKMEPTGSDRPDVLIVGESPSKSDDERGTPFSGKVGNILRNRIPSAEKNIRWANAVRCRPPSGRVPEVVEYTACFPKLERDVIATKPKAIFGFGSIPLYQIVNPSSNYRQMSLWRGRKMPVKIGDHVCWYYAFHHPSYINKLRKFEPKDLNSYGSEEEFAFVQDVHRAFADIQSGLPDPVIHSVAQATSQIELVEDINRLAELLEEAASAPSAGVDLETNCLRPYQEDAKILSMAVSSKFGTFAFPVAHSQAQWNKAERKQLHNLIKRFLYAPKCRKVVHHLPFELEWFGFFFGAGCFYASLWECTESQAYLLDARRGGLSLDFLCKMNFGLDLKAISGLDRKNLDKSPLQQVLKYNGIDARYHRELHLIQMPQLKARKMLDCYDHQMRRIPSLVLAQMHGVPVDQEVVNKFIKKYSDRALEIAAQIEKDSAVKEYEETKGKKFNPSSNPEVEYIMKEIIGVDLESSAKGELEHVDHPLAKKIVQWREANKMLSTYILPVWEGNKDSVLFADGMMHPIISTTTVITWRTSSEGPNIQNWTKRDEERKEVRGQIKSPNRNMRVVSFDYAGIQARNVAMESKDKRLIEVYWNNYDIHTEWRERIQKKYPKWIPKSNEGYKDEAGKLKAFRHLAKNKFVFPTFFGAQAFSVSESLNIPKNTCEELREEFFDEFHDIDAWHKQLEKFYRKNGYVTGLSGFRRYAPVSPNERINCVDTETECLTEYGWKHVDCLKEGMLIYTKNAKTGELELKPILKVNRARYRGPVHVLDGTISSVTTHNHRWLVDYQIDHGKNNGGLETVVKFVESIDLTSTKDPGKYKVHLTADRPCSQTGAGIWSDDEIRLIGWVLTDGCFTKVRLKRKNKDRVGVSVQQSIRGNPEKVAFIDALFDRLALTMQCQDGIKKLVNISIQDQGNYKSWITYSDLAERIVEALPDKTITFEFLQQLSTPQLQILFDTMLLGDGSWDKANNRYGGFTASSKERIDAFSMLCVLLGQPHRIFYNRPKQYPSHLKRYASMSNTPKVGGYWTINLNIRKRIQPGFYASWEMFDGEVWCPATVNQTFVARRKGSVYITGNTPIQSDESIIVMDAMARLSEMEDPRYQAMLMVHDDLTFLWPKDEIEKRAEVVVKALVNVPFEWANVVPIEVEMSVGEDWINMKEVAKFANDKWDGIVQLPELSV